MRRRALLVAAVICAGLALVSFALADESGTGASAGAAGAAAGGTSAGATGGAGAAAGSRAAAPGNAGATAATAAQLAQGRALFEASCSACHGLDARGISGRGPNLRGVGASAADFYLKTGRMPLSATRQEPLRTRPAFAPRAIEALTAYVGSFGGPAVPVVEPARGSLPYGQHLFALNCAGCHTIQGQGGIVTGAVVPSLNTVTPTQVGEAIRTGPYVMPRFSEGEISNGQIDSIARYVQSIQHPENRGGWGIGRIGPIPEGMVAWLLGIAALLLIARVIGERRESDPGGVGGPPGRGPAAGGPDA